MGDYTAKSKAIKIYAGGRRVGIVRGDSFLKCIRRQHFLTTPPAIACDVVALSLAEEAGASRVDVLDIDSGTHYFSSIAQIWQAGFRFNRGFGEQIGLPLHRWTSKQKNTRQLSLFREPNG